MSAEVLLHEAQQEALKASFLGWQCRVRQIAMRQEDGKPSPGICPEVILPGAEEPLGAIITLIHPQDPYETTMHFQHMVKQTHDPRERLESALKLLSSTYYQDSPSFSDLITALFRPGSEGGERIARAEACTLHFAQFSQSFTLPCEVRRLTRQDPFFQATFWHNSLFNEGLSEESLILGFKPDWARAESDPPPAV
ncbi:MAG: hypothetical protein WD489_11395 [Rhodovibrionaceae bacterium]